MSVTLESYGGGGIKLTVSSDIQLSYTLGRCVNLDVTGGGHSVNLGNALRIPRGSRIWLLWNSGGSSVTIRDFSGTSLFVLDADNVAAVGLSDNSTPNGDWIWLEKAKK